MKSGKALKQLRHLLGKSKYKRTSFMPIDIYNFRTSGFKSIFEGDKQ